MFTIVPRTYTHPIHGVEMDVFVVTSEKLTFIIHPDVETTPPQFDRAQLGFALGNIECSIKELKVGIRYLNRPKYNWVDVTDCTEHALDCIWANFKAMSITKPETGWNLEFANYIEVTSHWPQWMQANDPMVDFAMAVLWIHGACDSLREGDRAYDLFRAIECLEYAMELMQRAQTTLEAQWVELGLEKPVMWLHEHKWAIDNFPQVAGAGK